jgi:hypothetical protein
MCTIAQMGSGTAHIAPNVGEAVIMMIAKARISR